MKECGQTMQRRETNVWQRIALAQRKIRERPVGMR